MPGFRYDPPIEDADKAVWCLAQAERRYQGKRQFTDDFPYLVDVDGLSHTDDVLRAIGAAIFEGTFSLEEVLIH